MNNKVLVVGADGYIGANLVDYLSKLGVYDILCCARSEKFIDVGCCSKIYQIEDITLIDDWSEILKSVNFVVYLVGIAHVKLKRNSANLYDMVNYKAAIKLAKASELQNIKRFVYISSIGVLGDCTEPGLFFTNSSLYNPQNMYALSKMKAERHLESMAKTSLMKIVILRPPLVFGPKAPGNFRRIIRLISYGIPLPLCAFTHERNMISVRNLSSIIERCFIAPLGNFSKFVVSDDSRFSTIELATAATKYLNKKQLFFYVPLSLLKFLSKFIGYKDELSKVSSELRIDSSQTRVLLNWEPVQSSAEGLKEAVISYKPSMGGKGDKTTI
jgi:UDP-4-keto-D-QuiNAc 4-reductase